MSVSDADGNRLFDRRTIKGGGIKVIEWHRTADEVHAWHTDAELAAFDQYIDSLPEEVKKRQGYV
jgi:hypothetical protein